MFVFLQIRNGAFTENMYIGQSNGEFMQRLDVLESFIILGGLKTSS